MTTMTLYQIGEAMVAAERARQVELGYTRKGDLGRVGELLRASAAYRAAAISSRGTERARLAYWPWDEELWKPKGAFRDGVRSVALTYAAVDAAHRDGTKINATRDRDALDWFVQEILTREPLDRIIELLAKLGGHRVERGRQLTTEQED